MIDWVRADFGICLVAIEEITDGADVAARLWRGTTADGARYAIKLTTGGTEAGLIVTDFLSLPGVVAPVRALDGELWTVRDAKRLSVAPWVSDRHGWNGGVRAEQWTALGVLMARVHATALAEPIRSLLPLESYTFERAAAVPDRVRERGAHPADDLAAELMVVWDGPAADELRRGMERLATILRTERAPNVLCHADPHPGNVLLGPGAEVFLIDWDDTVRSPAERDLMFFIDGGIQGPSSQSAEQQRWFFEGYGEANVDPRRLAYFQCTRALEDLDFALTALDPATPQPNREIALSIVRANLSESGFIRTALRSLRTLQESGFRV